MVTSSSKYNDKALFCWEIHEFDDIFKKVLIDSLRKVADDPFRRMSISVSGKGVLVIANALLDCNQKQEQIQSFIKDKFYSVLTVTTEADSNTKEAMYSEWYKLTSNQTISERLQGIISDGMDSKLPFQQFVGILMFKILEQIINERSNMFEKSAEKRSSQISESDQGVLFYISGFIISSLQKEASKKIHNKKLMALKEAMQVCLKRESDSEKTFVSNYATWTEKINRGGLKIPSDNFFLFIRECELYCRQEIDENNLNKNTFNIGILKEKIMDRYMIKYYTEKFTTGEFSMYIIERCITIFLTIRGHSSARKRKNELLTDQQSKKSLRKVLKEKSLNTNV